jgi:fructuronate reductase
VRLAAATAARLSAEVQRPAYDRGVQQVGLVHLGLGAFHRAHQAVYTDDAMDAGDRDWAIAGVSLRSAAVRDQLAPQDGLYTVTARDGAGDPVRLIGAVVRALVAPEDPAAVVALLAAPSTRVVTLTVTEKGYARAADGGLDAAASDVAADLAAGGEGGAPPRTIHGYLCAALARRRDAGLAGPSIVSCDNLPGNGGQLARLLGDFAARRDAALARWIAAECAFPSTMVDRIVPASSSAFLDATTLRLGLRDEAAVATEPFRQWVIEDRFAGPRPRWEAGGALFVRDVAAYEMRKLRMLNGAHSALAYLGLERGHRHVHEAVRDPDIRPLVERLMRDEAASSLAAGAPAEVSAYADALFARFANPALEHRLAQIAMDGSQKIPQRWLATLRACRQSGKHCPAILEALAAWIVHVRGGAGRTVEDPLADSLARAWAEAGRDGIAAALFGDGGRFVADWQASPRELRMLTEAIAGRVG